MCKIIPQLFTETSQICQAPQSFIILLSISVCVKETDQRPNHLIHLEIPKNVISSERKKRFIGASKFFTWEPFSLPLEGKKS